ncbi:MAG TPA: hypothetical protein VGN12_28155 [Pirellulales bacterium]
MGYFTIALSVDSTATLKDDSSITVNVQVISIEHFDGNVYLNYWSTPDADYIDPASDMVYVPKSGTTNTTVNVEVPTGETVVFEAFGTGDDESTGSATIDLTG